MAAPAPDYQKIVESIERLAAASMVLSDPLAFDNAEAKAQLQALLSFQRKQAFWLSAEKLFGAFPEMESMKVGFKGDQEFFAAFKRNPKAHVIYFLLSPVWKEGFDEASLKKLNSRFCKEYAKIASRMGKSAEEKDDAVGPFKVSYFSMGPGLTPSVWGGFEKPLVWGRSDSDSVFARVFGPEMFGIWKSFKEAQDLVASLRESQASEPLPGKRPGAGRI